MWSERRCPNGCSASAGRHFRAFELDVTDVDWCERSVQQVLDEFGAVDVMINNAGVAHDSTFVKMTKEASRTSQQLIRVDLSTRHP
uniref:SDR family NAD(P)-dependent oxidoreductase n=1 Tax=Paraburkholderia terrae TaxID=311230 RepID=UPI003EB868F9